MTEKVNLASFGQIDALLVGSNCRCRTVLPRSYRAYDSPLHARSCRDAQSDSRL